jgi:hypothetical protein
MNRSNLNNRLNNISDELKEELDYYLDIEHEEPYDISDAFDDYMTIILNDKLTKEMQQILIDVGYTVEVDIRKVQVSHGKKYWFKRNGKYYDALDSWEAWINK